LRTVRAVGELDIATAPLLEERLRQTFEYHAGPTVLDLTEVSFIDRAGLRVLILAALRSREDRDRLRIRIGTGAVQRMIEATGVASLPLA
jgi:anti-anti-sigma factor